MNILMSLIILAQVAPILPRSYQKTVQHLEVGSCGWMFPWDIYDDWKGDMKQMKATIDPNAKLSPVLRDMQCVYLCRNPDGVRVMANGQCEFVGAGSLPQPAQVQVVQ